MRGRGLTFRRKTFCFDDVEKRKYNVKQTNALIITYKLFRVVLHARGTVGQLTQKRIYIYVMYYDGGQYKPKRTIRFVELR